jgi:hypothetical protein
LPLHIDGRLSVLDAGSLSTVFDQPLFRAKAEISALMCEPIKSYLCLGTHYFALSASALTALYHNQARPLATDDETGANRRANPSQGNAG